MAKAGTTASTPISPSSETAQRSRAMPSVMSAKRGLSGAVHRRVTYSARKMAATKTITPSSRSSTEAGSVSIEDSATASRPAPSAKRWNARQRLPRGLRSECPGARERSCGPSSGPLPPHRTIGGLPLELQRMCDRFTVAAAFAPGEGMEPRQVKTASDALKIVKERGLSHVKVGVHDIDGVLRGKYLHIDKFKSALDGGMGFCDVVLGWDAGDQLYDNVTMTGWHTGYPDA